MAETSASAAPGGGREESCAQDAGEEPEPEDDRRLTVVGAADAAKAPGRAVAVVLPAAPASVRAARAWLRATLAGSHVDAAVVEGAELLVSEVATNAVRHASGTQFEVRLMVGTVLEVSVHDQDPAGDLRPLRSSSDSCNGRGLAIVAALSQDWGVRRRHGGKAVWFRIGLPGLEDHNPPTG